MHLKFGLIKGGASIERDNYVVFYYLCACEIWSEKRSGLWWEGHYGMGTTENKLTVRNCAMHISRNFHNSNRGIGAGHCGFW